MKSPGLHELVSKGHKLSWNHQHRFEFHKLRSELVKSLVLRLFDQEADVVITTMQAIIVLVRFYETMDKMTFTLSYVLQLH